MPISFADNVALEELSLVIDTDKSENKSVYRLRESVRCSRFFESDYFPAERSTGIARYLPTDPRIGRDAMTYCPVFSHIEIPTDPRIGRDAMTYNTHVSAFVVPTDPRIGRDAMTGSSQTNGFQNPTDPRIGRDAMTMVTRFIHLDAPTDPGISDRADEYNASGCSCKQLTGRTTRIRNSPLLAMQRARCL